MKTLQKNKKKIVTLGIFLSLVTTTLLQHHVVGAQGFETQDCTGFTNQTGGTLSGYIVATNLPQSGDQEKIWVNSENDIWDGGPQYAVSYNPSTQTFSGRGWNETLRVWVDFSYGSNDQARVFDTTNSPIGGFTWGGWNGIIQGLTGLQYNATTNTFDGPNPYDSQYVSGQSNGDVLIGLGELLFDNVTMTTTAIPSECLETVNVTANGVSSLNLPNCSSTATIAWNASNVNPGTCTAVNNSAPWPNPGSIIPNNGSVQSGTFSILNPTVQFRVQCVGTHTGNNVIGIATVNCGNSIIGIGPGTGPGGTGNNFEFIES